MLLRLMLQLKDKDLLLRFSKTRYMNHELDQQIKFTELFIELTKDAPQNFKNIWDENITFPNPSHAKIIPNFNNGAINALPVQLRAKFEILRKKYYDKSL